MSSSSTGTLELWLVRHGESTWNGEGRIQGQSDPPLSERGRAQARALADRLEDRIAARHFDRIYSSDLQRAHDTAERVLERVGDRSLLPPVTLDARLREIAFGVLEGRRYEELDGDEGRILEAWRASPYETRVPGGETYVELTERALAWLHDVPRGGRALAFTHGGTIRALLHAFTGRPTANEWRFSLDNTGISRIVVGSLGAILHSVNDAAHLERLPAAARHAKP